MALWGNFRGSKKHWALAKRKIEDRGMDENGKGGETRNTRLFGPFVEPPWGPFVAKTPISSSLPLFFFQFQKAPRRILEMPPSSPPFLVLFIPISLKSSIPPKNVVLAKNPPPTPIFSPFCGPFPQRQTIKNWFQFVFTTLMKGKGNVFFELFGKIKIYG
jgi:hypothetical protein